MSVAITNARYAITLGKAAGGLADALKDILKKDALIEVVRLALLNLRLLIIGRRAGWEMVFRTKDGEEFTFDLDNPFEIVPVQKTKAARVPGQGGSAISHLIAPQPIPVSEFERAMFPKPLFDDGQERSQGPAGGGTGRTRADGRARARVSVGGDT